MSDPLEPLAMLTGSIVTRLNACCKFDQADPVIPVLEENLSDLTVQFQNAITSRAGLAILVLTPQFDLGDQPEIVEPRITLHICENVVENQSDKGAQFSALRAAWLIYFTLLRWAPPGWSVLLPLEGQRPVSQLGAGPAKLTSGVEIPYLITYEVVLGTSAVFSLQAVTPPSP